MPGKEIQPRRMFSGKFNVRIPNELHARLTLTVKSVGKSLDQFVREALEEKRAHSEETA